MPIFNFITCIYVIKRNTHNNSTYMPENVDLFLCFLVDSPSLLLCNSITHTHTHPRTRQGPKTKNKNKPTRNKDQPLKEPIKIKGRITAQCPTLGPHMNLLFHSHSFS